MTDKLWDLNVLLCAACDHGEEGGTAFDFNPSRFPAFGRLVEALTVEGERSTAPSPEPDLVAKIRELSQRVIMKYEGKATPPTIVLAEFEATFREIIRLTETP